MIGHCGVVRRRRSAVSSSGNETTSARPMSRWSASSATKIRLQTTQPGLLTPLSVPPPRRKYIAGWRSLTEPFHPPMRWAGGTAPEISKTQT